MDYEIDGNESLSMAVVRAVSAVTGRSPDALQPLGEVLDPDALNRIFDVRNDGDPRSGGRISFIYSDCRITIDNGEYLTIDPITNSFQPRYPLESRLDGDGEQPMDVE